MQVTSNIFLGYLAALPASKVARVAEAKRMIENPRDFAAHDFWLGLRVGLVDFLGGRVTENELRSVAAGAHIKKQANYSAATEAAISWRGKRPISLSPVSPAIWSHGSLDVKVAPEILVKGSHPRLTSAPTVIKLYLRKDPISRNQAAPLLRLIELTHGATGTAAILDVLRGKLYQGPTRNSSHLDLLLQGEALSFYQTYMAL